MADIYDAMTSNRPYRRAMKPNVAINELKKQSGNMFDPVVVEAFFHIVGSASEDGRKRKKVALKSEIILNSGMIIPVMK